MRESQWRGEPFGRLNPNVGSRFMKLIEPWHYNPEPKLPSKRDQHREDVRNRRRANG